MLWGKGLLAKVWGRKATLSRLAMPASIARSVWIIALGVALMCTAIIGSAFLQMKSVQRLDASAQSIASLDTRARSLEKVIHTFHSISNELIASGNSDPDSGSKQLELYSLVNQIGVKGAQLASVLPEAGQILNPYEAERDATDIANFVLSVGKGISSKARFKAEATVEARIASISARARALSDRTRSIHRQSQANVSAAIANAFTIILIVGAASVIGGGIFIHHLIYFIARPARAMARTTLALAGGQLDVSIPRVDLAELNHISLALESFRKSARIERDLAYCDVGSGLPNRRAFLADLKNCVSDRPPQILCLMDVDRFKDVNDLYGHDVGDALVLALAKRLTVGFPDARVFRIGGDEFALLQAAAGTLQPAQLAARVIASMQDVFRLGDCQLLASCSVGLTAVNIGDTPDILIREADLALNHVKRNGRNGFAVYDAKMLESDERARGLERDLILALKGDALRLAYQPIHATTVGQADEVEALLRWNHPELGAVPPLEFVGIAERSGMMVELGHWVFDRAFRDMKQWRDVRVSINMSPIQLRAPEFGQQLLTLAKNHGIAPHRVELEITESVAIENSERVLLTLSLLRSYGFRIALDDFGTGYSSLAVIKTYPLDRIKLDRTLLHGFGEDEAAAAVLDAAVAMGARLQLEVVAEGVEHLAQADAMAQLGCTHLQGYYFSHPLEADGVKAYFDAQDKRQLSYSEAA